MTSLRHPSPPQAARLPDPYRPELPVVQALATLAGAAIDWSAVIAKAKPWVEAVRSDPAPFWAMESLLREYPISSAEGLSLMRLAEALLRVPDAETAVIFTADQLGRADFDAAGGGGGGAEGARSMMASLSSSAIALSKKFLPEGDDPPGVLQRLGAKTVVAATVRAIQLLGRQFVLGRNIQEAMGNANSARRAEPTLRFSYDMLGEGARTEADAKRYLAAYQQAIVAIAAGRKAPSPWTADGISIKLSALFSRYHEAHRHRVFAELLPRVMGLVDQAARANINLTIDAEESDRLEISLDVLDVLAAHVKAAHPGWGGLGLAVQAYQTRAVAVVDAVAAIARKHRLSFMVRLVKGAYWDGEVKRAQEEGLPGYPVFTHKHHTDIAYLACAHRLFANADVIYPQFATHNAATVAAILHMARARKAPFELQRLHGMGEGVYREVMKDPTIACRIYAPVGEHRDLLAYLVRRLLENGANSSFVHQLSDVSVPPDLLLASPMQPSAQPGLPLPVDLYGAERKNSMGADLACLAMQTPLLEAVASTRIEAVRETSSAEVDAAMNTLHHGVASWQALGAPARAAIMRRAADLLEARMPQYCGLLVHEGHRVLADGVSEVREAVDFCRYYAVQAESQPPSQSGCGVFVCISPWNFPLAIFAGQVVAALVAGNTVAAKPAEQTPVVARHFVELLYEAGVPRDAVQWVHGPGETVGAALTLHPHTAGVCFTGSTQVARIIQRTLAASRADRVVPLIAETGGLNAMIVDSTALPEQVIDAVVQSAFRSAGQRCSALRLLVVHASVADTVIGMLQGAMQTLTVGDAALIDTDVGPVIDAEAHQNLSRHIERLSRSARLLGRTPITSPAANLIAPVAFELAHIHEMTQEVFGPVLHVVRWQGDVEQVVQQINALGYGLTLGVQTRIDSRAARIADLARIGNVYVNRNMVGAVVGVQPFGGEGQSGTGPKAGGPHYLHRLVQVDSSTQAQAALDAGRGHAHSEAERADVAARVLACVDAARASAWAQTTLDARCNWLAKVGSEAEATAARQQLSSQWLPGPTGESNELRLHPRGVFGAVADTVDAVVLSTWMNALVCGNPLVIVVPAASRGAAQRAVAAWVAAGLPPGAAQLVDAPFEEAAAVLACAEPVNGLVAQPHLAVALNRHMVARAGAIVPLVTEDPRRRLWRLSAEQTVTINTAAAGGNAALLAGIHA